MAIYKMTTIQNMELGRQHDTWHHGKRIIKIQLIDKTHPYLITYSDGSQTTCDAAELVTYS